MDPTHITPITPYKYYELKKMEIHMKKQGLFRLTMGTKLEPI